MFKKIASEALGLSDIGKIIGKEDFDKVDTDDYIMHEEKNIIGGKILKLVDISCA